MQQHGLSKIEKVARALSCGKRFSLSSECVAIARKMAAKGASSDQIAAAIGWQGSRYALVYRLKQLSIRLRGSAKTHFLGVDVPPHGERV